MPAKSVTEERVQRPRELKAENVVHGVKISHPARLVWPSLGISKLDLARYYDGVAERILPHVAKRPLTLVRCPDGAEGECFYQRHLAAGASPGEVKTFKRERSSKGHYIYIESHGALVSLVQNGAIELHTWGAKLPDARHPDRITMDLDPDEDLSWRELVRATGMTRTLIEGLKLRCFLKTTGGKGLHVVVPIRPKLAWDELTEDEDVRQKFTVQTLPQRLAALKEDPWADYAKTRQSITAAMWRALGRK